MIVIGVVLAFIGAAGWVYTNSTYQACQDIVVRAANDPACANVGTLHPLAAVAFVAGAVLAAVGITLSLRTPR